jgi:hypothetical protein
MKVGTDHFLKEARREFVSGKGTAMPVRRALVIHFASGATTKNFIEPRRAVKPDPLGALNFAMEHGLAQRRSNEVLAELREGES